MVVAVLDATAVKAMGIAETSVRERFGLAVLMVQLTLVRTLVPPFTLIAGAASAISTDTGMGKGREPDTTRLTVPLNVPEPRVVQAGLAWKVRTTGVVSVATPLMGSLSTTSGWKWGPR